MLPTVIGIRSWFLVSRLFIDQKASGGISPVATGELW